MKFIQSKKKCIPLFYFENVQNLSLDQLLYQEIPAVKEYIFW